MRSIGKILYFWFTLILLINYIVNSINFYNPGDHFKSLIREKRYVSYPSGTAIGLLLAIALPVDVPEENLYFSLNFEANYNLPDNITQYYDSDIGKIFRSITRRTTYERIESILQQNGLNGRQCLLRAICDATRYKMHNHNGLLGSILQIIFQPSLTRNENLPEEYEQAEASVYKTKNCQSSFPNCSISILDMISTIIEI